MKKVLSVVLLAVFLLSIPVSTQAAHVSQFTDVKTSDWFYKAVDYAVSSKLFNGTSSTTFSPNDGMTRGMFVTVLANKSKVETANYRWNYFYDVSGSAWYGPSVNWAHINGIVSGVGDYMFEPNTSITREQMATMLYQYVQKTGNDTSYSEERFNEYPDCDHVSSYAKAAMKWTTHHKIINGSNGLLDPKGTATRAQVAQMFKNADALLISPNLTNPAPPIAPPSPPPQATPTPSPTPYPAPSPTPSPTPSPPPSTVYWVDGGKSYHKLSNCRTLARSKNIRRGSIEEAKKNGKHDQCNVCFR